MNYIETERLIPSPQNISSLFAKEPIPADKNTRLTQH